MSEKLREAAQAVVDAFVEYEDSPSLDALRAALSEPEWIPVSEPPETRTWYLVAWYDKSEKCWEQDIALWLGGDFDNGHCDVEFSHWRSLPSPPEIDNA